MNLDVVSSHSRKIAHDLFTQSRPILPAGDLRLGETFRDFPAESLATRLDMSAGARNILFTDVTLETISVLVYRGSQIIHGSGYQSQPERDASYKRLEAGVDTRFARHTVFMAINKFSNYYHWIAEMLPAIAGYMLSPDFRDGILLLTADRYINDVMYDSLQCVLPDQGRPLIRAADHRPLGIGRLVFSSFIHPHKWSDFAGHVYDNIAQRVCPAAVAPFRRIYVSRADALRSPLINEDRLIALLERHGFETILPGSLTFAQQVQTFREAHIIIGTHGAGLANIAFCCPGTLLYELFPSVSLENTCYNIISQGRGLHYWADVFYCPTPPCAGWAGLQQVSWQVNLDVVARRLAAIEQRLSRS